MAAEPALSLKIACEYWKRRKLNPDCDRDDIRATTRRINGGLNGLEDRSNYIRKAKEALARIEGIQLTGAVSDPRPVLRRGSTGAAVGDLQTMLSKLKFASPSIRISARRPSLPSCAFRATRNLPPTASSARKPGMRSRKPQEARACRHVRANFLYLMRFGSTASSPRRRFLSSS